MSPRSYFAFALAFGLPLLTGACGVPLGVTAASYGVDGALAMTTDKTSTDHLLSMTSKQDCSVWRIFRHQVVCKDRPDGKDPYAVDYDEPFRMGPDGYGPPLRAAAGAPSHSWDSAVYKPAAPQAPAPVEPAAAVAEVTTNPVEPPAQAAPAAPPAAPRKKAVGRTKAKKRSQGQVASVR
jgi:hypothetical protein